MGYIPADIARRAAEGARKLRAALDEDDSRASAEVIAALQDPNLRLYLETWVMPALDDLRTVVTLGVDAL